MNIKGYHYSSKQGLANSFGIVNKDDPLTFLLKDTKGAIGVFYHLDYAVAQLLRYLKVPETGLRELFETGQLVIKPWIIRYKSKKFLNITYDPNYNLETSTGNPNAPFTNLSDMYQWHHNSDLTEMDVVQYAKLAQDIGQEVYSTLADMNLHPKSLVSPVNVFGKEILSTMDLPTVVDIPEEAGLYAYNCLQGSWVEAFKKGHFEKVYDYDLRSAYSSFLAKLLDTRFGEWYEQKEYIDEAHYGYCKCWVDIESEFSPVQLRKGKNNFTPTGPYERYLNKAYIDFIYEYDIGTVEILNGHWWVPTGSELVYPLEEMIIDLNKWKDRAKSKLARQVIKRIPNGIWGKLIEQRKDGDCYNFMPPWACECDNETTLEDARFVLDNELYPDHLLQIVVDGVTSTKEVQLEKSDEMGSWQLTNTGAAFVIGSGVCAIEGKDGEGEFALTYNWLKDQILEKPQASRYSMSKLSPVSVMQVVKGTDKIEKLGLHKKITRIVDVGKEVKREYAVEPMDGEQLMNNEYSSLPWGISIIEGLPKSKEQEEILEED